MEAGRNAVDPLFCPPHRHVSAHLHVRRSRTRDLSFNLGRSGVSGRVCQFSGWHSRDHPPCGVRRNISGTHETGDREVGKGEDPRGKRDLARVKNNNTRKEVIKMRKTRYVSTWRNKWITAGASSIDDFIHVFEHLAKKFQEWKEMGIKLDPESSMGDDYADFYTEDMDVAIKAGFTVHVGNDKTTAYLITDTGREVKVPKEKLTPRDS